jgi:hypothetical protein
VELLLYRFKVGFGLLKLVFPGGAKNLLHNSKFKAAPF